VGDFRNGFLLIISLFLIGCGSTTTYAPVVNGWQSAAGKRSVYIVQPGDTLYSIAWAFNMDFRDLARGNQLTQPYLIHPGQRLRMTTMVVKKPVQRTALAKKPLMAKQSMVSRLPERSVTHWLWPAKGKVIEKFSTKPGANKGINIGGNYAEPVVASAAGVVVYSGAGLPSYGKLIIIKHNDDYLSAYAFNQSILVKENSQVKAGQKIAEMGRNNAGKTMLHFEIRRNGKPVDPLRYLKEEISGACPRDKGDGVSKGEKCNSALWSPSARVSRAGEIE